jgi:hypothetical protein
MPMRPASATATTIETPPAAVIMRGAALPMQRNDIADHIGLTIETASRTLIEFARNGPIALSAGSRTIALVDKVGLKFLDA